MEDLDDQEFNALPDDDDDDIARFERECRARARAEGQDVSDDEEDRMSNADDQEIIKAKLLHVKNEPASKAEWQQKAEVLEIRLRQANDDLQRAKEEVQLLQGDGDGGMVNELKQRLLELTKKNRRMNVTNESLKAKVKEFEAEVSKSKQAKAAEVAEALEGVCPGLNELEDFKRKFLQASNKLQEVRHEVQELKVTVQRQKKVLGKELGSEEAVEKALRTADDPQAHDWRGRASQISSLQRQVRDLKEQLRRGGGGEDFQSGTPKRASAPQVRDADTEATLHPSREKAQEKLSDLASKRREELDKAKEEVDKLTAENAELRKKDGARKSRANNLETQMRELKAHVQTLLAKSENDDSLVEVLRKQLGRHGPCGGAQASSSMLQDQEERCNELQTQVDRQAQIILQLKQKSLSEASKNGSVRIGPEASADERTVIERVRFLEAENAKQTEHIRLLEHGGAGSRPCSAESTLKASQKGMQSRLAELERENRHLREIRENAQEDDCSGPNQMLVKQNDALKREILRLRNSQGMGVAS